MMFKGSMVALVTPMNDDGTVDKQALCDLTEWHIASGTDAIIAVGTTGESATLYPEEQIDVITTVVKQAAGRIPVIAGAGTNSTQTAMILAENAKRAGASGLLIVTPYYNKPTQNGLYEHYKAIAESTDLPIILYNVPGRTGCDLLPTTVARLATLDNIVGIKEATANVERAKEIMQLCGTEFDIYSGDDPTALDLMLAGATGVISVTANVAPTKMSAMCKAALSGDHKAAKKLNDELMPLHKQLFLESNPIPTKWALFSMGKIGSTIRMPLLPLDKKYHDEVKKALQQAGVEE